MLLLEPDGSITYKGSVVGRAKREGDKQIVEIALTYFADGDDWITPLARFADGLRQIETPPPPVVFVCATGADDLEEPITAPRLLTEKQIKRDGYIWRFHKTDVDPWPSALHGHDADQGLTLDAITGRIYDAATRKPLGCLKRKKLAAVHKDLLACDDLKEAAHALLDA